MIRTGPKVKQGLRCLGYRGKRFRNGPLRSLDDLVLLPDPAERLRLVGRQGAVAEGCTT